MYEHNSNASTGYSLFAIHIQEIIDTEFTCLSIVYTAYYLYRARVCALVRAYIRLHQISFDSFF